MRDRSENDAKCAPAFMAIYKESSQSEIANSGLTTSSAKASFVAANEAGRQGVNATSKRERQSRQSRRKGSDGEELRARVYNPSDISIYKFRDRLLIRAAGLLIYLLIRVTCSTLRWEIRGGEHLEAIRARGHRAIFTSWHSCMFSATWFWRNRGIVVMSSRSRDAEFTGRFIKRFGYGTSRGSSTRGGGQALSEMAECLSQGMDVGFTIDGPRGPAFVAKPGAVTLARHTGQAILPFHISARRYWELPSWDRLQIPKPFTRAVAVIGEPIYALRNTSKEEVATIQDAVQSTLDRLRAEAEASARGD